MTTFKQLFLTSAVSFVAHDLVKHIDLSQNNKLVFIDTAAEPETGEKQWLADDRQSLVDGGFEVTDYTISGKSLSQIQEDLKQFKYICMSGGNTYHLLKESIASDFITYIRKIINNGEKVYLGSSAGSVISNPILPECLQHLDNPMETGLEESEAYHLVNFISLPHWGSNDFKDRYLKSIQAAYINNQYPLILLTDTQYIHVQDDQIEIIQV